MTERWTNLAGWENIYEISDLGRIRSNPKTNSFGILRKTSKVKILTPFINRSGNVCFRLTKNGTRYTVYISEAVLESFSGIKVGYDSIAHKDGNKLNNELTNLEVIA